MQKALCGEASSFVSSQHLTKVRADCPSILCILAAGSKTLPFVRLQRGQRLHLWYIGTRKSVEVLTGCRVRHITSVMRPSWPPSSAENEYGAKFPQNPASMGLSGQNDI
jgi:hypothetical protein